MTPESDRVVRGRSVERDGLDFRASSEELRIARAILERLDDGNVLEFIEATSPSYSQRMALMELRTLMAQWRQLRGPEWEARHRHKP